METLFRLSPEFHAARSRFGAFLRERVRPGAEARDRDCAMVPNAVFKEAAQIGLVGMTAPREAGGGGSTWWNWGQTLEAVAYDGDDSSFSMLLSYRETAANLLFRTGRKELIDGYLVPHIRGESFVGWAFTEIADIFLGLETRSTRVQGGYRVTGRKEATTGGLGDHAFLVYATNESGTDYRVLLVHSDDPGVSLSPRPTMGLRGMGIATLVMENVFVPDERVVEAHDGLSHAQVFVGERRLTGSSWITGRLFTLIEKTIDTLSGLSRGGEPVTRSKAIQAEIGRMVIGTQVVRSANERMLRDADAGAGASALSVASGKYIAATYAIEVAHVAQRILGGFGYWQDRGLDRYLRDFYGLLPIVGGPVVIEMDLGSRAIDHYEMEKRNRRP